MTRQNGENALKIEGTRVLVTGGSGFIGRAVCRRLNDAGAAVLNYDLKPWAGPDAGPETVIGDIEDSLTVVDAFRKHDPTVVIHLAAFASVTASLREDFSSIWNGTRSIADAFSTVSAPSRMINISTQLVIKPGPQPTDLRAYAPYTPYGYAKAEAEMFLDGLSRPFDVVHVRPANIWGPHHPSYASSIMRYIERGWYLHPALPEPVFRTYGFVENCAAQIISAAFSNHVGDGTILYGGDKVMDSQVFLDALSLKLRNAPVRKFPVGPLQFAAATGTALRRLGVPFPFEKDRLMRMSTSYSVPLSTAHDVMMFPAVSFEDGMRQTIEWYKKGAKAVWMAQ